MTPIADNLFIAVRAFIIAALPSFDPNKIIQGLDNLTPMPQNEAIVITATGQKRLSTNRNTYTVDQNRLISMPTEYDIQVDCYGENASDNATILKALWRDQFGVEQLVSIGAPLYATEPIQMPLINGENNYEKRWTFTALLQFNPVITVPQQSATDLVVSSINVDTQYPPT